MTSDTKQRSHVPAETAGETLPSSVWPRLFWLIFLVVLFLSWLQLHTGAAARFWLFLVQCGIVALIGGLLKCMPRSSLEAGLAHPASRVVLIIFAAIFLFFVLFSSSIRIDLHDIPKPPEVVIAKERFASYADARRSVEPEDLPSSRGSTKSWQLVFVKKTRFIHVKGYPALEVTVYPILPKGIVFPRSFELIPVLLRPSWDLLPFIAQQPAEVKIWINGALLPSERWGRNSLVLGGPALLSDERKAQWRKDLQKAHARDVDEILRAWETLVSVRSGPLRPGDKLRIEVYTQGKHEPIADEEIIVRPAELLDIMVR